MREEGRGEGKGKREGGRQGGCRASTGKMSGMAHAAPAER
jgi:hypothetical protein